MRFARKTAYYVFDNEVCAQLLKLFNLMQVLDQSPNAYKHLFSFEPYSTSTIEDAPMNYLEAMTQASLDQQRRYSAIAPPASIKRQFFLGPATSGAPFHHHGPAFNAIA